MSNTALLTLSRFFPLFLPLASAHGAGQLSCLLILRFLSFIYSCISYSVVVVRSFTCEKRCVFVEDQKKINLTLCPKLKLVVAGIQRGHSRSSDPHEH